MSLALTERAALIASLSYALATGALSLAVPLAAQALLQNVAFAGLLQPVVILAILVCVGLLFAGVLTAAQTWLIEMVSRRLFVKVSLRFAERLSGARADALQGRDPLALANRFFDVVSLEKSAAAILVDGPSAFLQLVVGMTLLAIYHPIFLGMAVALLLALGAILALGRGAAMSAVSESSAKYELADWIEEIAHKPGVFQSAHGQSYAFQRAEGLAEEWLEKRRRHFRAVFLQIVGLIATSGTLTALLLGVGGALVVEGQLTLGQLVAAELVAAIAAAAMTRLGKLLGKIYDMGASLEKIAQVAELDLDEVSEPLPPSEAISVRARGLTLPGGVLDFEVAAGEKVVIHGEGGAGKTMLLDFLAGRTTGLGHLELNGLDARRVSNASVRDQVALIGGQGVIDGTVEENLKMGREVPAARVFEVLREVGLKELVDGMPHGVLTPLRDAALPREHRLKLELARALLISPGLILVDGALDCVTPAARAAILERVLAGPWTALIVSHTQEVAAACAREIRIGSSEEVRDDA